MIYNAVKAKKSVRIRREKELQKKWKNENIGNLGSVKSVLRNVPTSPRKMRLTADMIRGKKVSEAINILKFEHKHSSDILEKLLMTAISDWQMMNVDIKIEDADLYVKSICVDSGRILKRLRPAPQGRAHRIKKRSNHVSIMIDDRSIKDASKTLEENIEK